MSWTVVEGNEAASGMKLGRRAVAIAAGASLALCGWAEANAAAYAGAHLFIDDMFVIITDASGANPLPISFDFQASTSSSLNGAGGPLEVERCGGTFGFSDCGPPGPEAVLDPTPSSIGGAGHANNAFGFLGPRTAEYASADSVIQDALLLGDPGTSVEGIAEAELTTGSDAGAASSIRSTTEFTFTLEGAGTFLLSARADPDLRAEFDDGEASGGTARARLITSLTLIGPEGLAVEWKPDGSAANNCSFGNASLVCAELADTQDLNRSIVVGPGASDRYSLEAGLAPTPFAVFIGGLPEGDYSFTLSAVQEASVTRLINDIPEPGTLLLTGWALAGFGLVPRRRVQKA